MKITRESFKNIVREVMTEESEYQEFFKRALEKTGKSIPDMSDEEKKAFFNKIDSAWQGKGEKNEELVGNQHKLDVDGDGEIEASDLAALRAGKKVDESINEAGGTVRNPKTGKDVKISTALSYGKSHPAYQAAKQASGAAKKPLGPPPGVKAKAPVNAKPAMGTKVTSAPPRNAPPPVGTKVQSAPPRNAPPPVGTKVASPAPTNAKPAMGTKVQSAPPKNAQPPVGTKVTGPPPGVKPKGAVPPPPPPPPPSGKPSLGPPPGVKAKPPVIAPPSAAKPAGTPPGVKAKPPIVKLPNTVKPSGAVPPPPPPPPPSGKPAGTPPGVKAKPPVVAPPSAPKAPLGPPPGVRPKGSVPPPPPPPPPAPPKKSKFEDKEPVEEANTISAPGEWVAYLSMTRGKKLLKTFNTARGAKQFLSKNVDKLLGGSNVESVGIMTKKQWDEREAKYAIEGVNEVSSKEKEIYTKIEKLRVLSNAGKITGDEFLDKFMPLWKQLKGMKSESVNEGKKRFKQQDGVGSSKYTISYHDGKKKHKDGSDFFDIKIFKNKPELEAFKKDLVSKGFVSESVVNEASKPTIKIVTKLKNEQGIQIVVVKTTKGETEYGGFVVRGKLQKVIPVGANKTKEDVKKRALQIWDEFGKQLGESVNEAANLKTIAMLFQNKGIRDLVRKDHADKLRKIIEDSGVSTKGVSDSELIKVVKQLTNESVNEATLEKGTKLRYEKNTFVVDYVVDKKYIGRDGYPRYILKVVKSNYPNKIKVGSTEEYEDSRLTGLIRNRVMTFIKNEVVNETTLEKGTKLRYDKNSNVVDYVVDKKYIGRDGYPRYILKVVKSNTKNIKVGSTIEYDDARLTGLIRNRVMMFIKNESVNEGQLSNTWQKNNKKGYVLKVGNIELKSAGPTNVHDIFVNRLPWGTFHMDYESGGTDFWVKPLRGNDFWVKEIDDIVKRVKASK